MLSNTVEATRIMFNQTQGYGAKLYWEATKDIANNASYITRFDIYLSRYNSKINIGSRNVTVKIADKTYDVTTSAVNDTANNLTKDHLVYSKTFTNSERIKINHAASGIGEFYVSMSYPINITASWVENGSSKSLYIGTATLQNTKQDLDSIPRAPIIKSAQLSSNTINVVYTPQISDYYNKLVLKVGNTQITTFDLGKQDKDIEVSKSNTLTTTNLSTIANMATNSSIVNIDVYIQAYKESSYTTLIGNSASTSVAYTLDSTYKPKITNVVLSNTVPNPSNIGSLYVQGKSKLRLNVTASGVSSNVTIKQYTVEITGIGIINSETNIINTDIIDVSGSLDIKVTVTDNRNLSSDPYTTNIDVYPYNAPKAISLDLAVVNSSGEEEDDGEYLEVTYSYEISSINNKNTISVYLQRYNSSTQVWGSVKSIANGYKYSGTQRITTYQLSSGTGNKFRLLVNDAYNSPNDITVTIPETNSIFTHNDNVMCFGGVLTKNDIFEFKKPLAVRGLTNLLVSNETDETTLPFVQIVENTNWIAYKYATGELICIRKEAVIISASSASTWKVWVTSGIYTIDYDVNESYPVPFVQQPLRLTSVQFNSTTTFIPFAGQNSSYNGAEKFGRITILRTSQATGTFFVNVEARGRWK